MKILMTTDTVGGIWNYSMDLCRSFGSYNATIHLVTMGSPMEPWQHAEVNALSNVYVYETDYKLEWMQDPWADISACGSLLLALEYEIAPDIIHLNSYSFGNLPFKAPVLIVAHSDVFSWYLSVKKRLPSEEWSEYFRHVKEGLIKADLVVAPSYSSMGVLQSIYSINGELRVIRNGRDPQMFYRRKKRPYIFSMGRIWDEAKNIGLLTVAAPNIHATIKVAGEKEFDGYDFTQYADNMVFTGKLCAADIARELAAASIYVLPARYEPFGLSVLEAAFSSCALVLGDIPTLRELWGNAALYANVDDPDDLAKKVNQLMDSESLLREYRVKAKMQANKYTAFDMAQNYVHAYTQLLQTASKLTSKVII